jgi:uncharacterized protein YccT (UPF0319 family)
MTEARNQRGRREGVMTNSPTIKIARPTHIKEKRIRWELMDVVSSPMVVVKDYLKRAWESLRYVALGT